MAKARRVKPYSFTTVQKKTGKERKEQQVTKLREAFVKQLFTYVVEFHNFKTNTLQDIREFFENGTIFMGSNRIMQVALGATKEDAIKPGSELLSALCTHGSSLIFTDKTIHEIKTFMQQYLEEQTFATAGDIADRTVTVDQEHIDSLNFPSTMQPLLESLELKSKLDLGRILILTDYTICTEGEVLDSRQAKLLKLLGFPISSRTFKILGVYDNEAQEFKKISV